MSDQQRMNVAVVRLPHEGTRHELSRAPGSSRRIIIGGDQTSGALALSDLTAPGLFGGPPQHIHHHFEEMFYVLDGRVEVLSGREIVKAEAGDVIVVPPLLAHAFAAERGSSADILIIIAPGVERFEYFRSLFDI